MKRYRTALLATVVLALLRLALGVGLWTLCVGAGPLVAWFFEEPDLIPVAAGIGRCYERAVVRRVLGRLIIRTVICTGGGQVICFDTVHRSDIAV